MGLEIVVFFILFYFFHLFIKDVIGLDVTGIECFEDKNKSNYKTEDSEVDATNYLANSVFWSDMGNH